MANKYAVASGLWSATATWSDTDGGAPGAAVPADGDAVFISAAVLVQMNADLSAYTGLQTVTIRGGATPGMLYFTSGTSGYLKLRTGYNLVGTLSTNYGRLLANSDGVWGHTGALPFADKAVIDLQGTATIVATNLDIAVYDTEPTNKWARTYGTKYDFTASGSTVNVTNDTIDLGTAPPSAGTAVMITTVSGTLPGGLQENAIYYVRAVSGNTCKLASQNADAQIIDLLSTGSGTCTLFTGHTNTSTAVMNVLDDVTADTPWVTTAGHNRVCLVNLGPQNYDQQRVTLTTITSTTITLSANVDSVQYPGARIGLAARNVSIRSAGISTSQPIIDFSGASTRSGVFRCEIVNTAGSGTTFYGRGVVYGAGHTISGTVLGCNDGVIYGAGHTISGTVLGCTYGVYVGTGHTISGTVLGCNNGVIYGTGHTISGTVLGCTYGVYMSYDCRITGKIGYRADGSAVPNTTTFRFSAGDDSTGLYVVLRAATIPSPPTFSLRNTVGVGSRSQQGVYSEDHALVAGARYAFLPTGDVIKNTTTIRPGGASSSLETIPLSNCAPGAEMRVAEWAEQAVAASQQTKTIYVKGEGWSTFPTAGQLYLEVEYISNGTTLARTLLASTQVLTDNTTWTALSVTFTPALAGAVCYRVYLATYAAACKVYVDIGANEWTFGAEDVVLRRQDIITPTYLVGV
jgi:hypothetical protein